MNIEYFLDEVGELCEWKISSRSQDGQMIRAMYHAIKCTMDASKLDNDNRLAVFIQLLMAGVKEKNHQDLVIPFMDSIIAADYYFSVMKAKKATSFMKKALDSLSLYLEEELPSLITDDEEFIQEFRVRNLKGQKQRENDAVNNIYILNAAVEKLDLIDLALPELLMDYVPKSWHLKHMAFLLVLSFCGGSLMGFPMAESMAPWRKAIADGTPVSLWEAFVPMDMPSFVIGLVLIVLAFVFAFGVGGTGYIRVMSKWSYWRFNR